jgi:hypothetical protein
MSRKASPPVSLVFSVSMITLSASRTVGALNETSPVRPRARLRFGADPQPERLAACRFHALGHKPAERKERHDVFGSGEKPGVEPGWFHDRVDVGAELGQDRGKRRDVANLDSRVARLGSRDGIQYPPTVRWPLAPDPSAICLNLSISGPQSQ